jgi:hypothetical protein
MSLLGIIASSKQQFNPLNLTGLKLWLDASDTSTISLSGSSVTRWADKSGNTFDFVQATAADQPSSGINTKNGLNVISFASDKMQSEDAASTWTFMSNATGCTVFMVIEVTGTNNPSILDNEGQQSSSPGFAITRTNATSRIDHYVENASNQIVILNQPSSSMSVNVWYYFTVLSDPNNGTAADRSKISMNNGSFLQSNTSSNTLSTANPQFTLGIGPPPGGQSNPGTYKIGEIVICEGLVSQTDIDKMDSYLATKWGI